MNRQHTSQEKEPEPFVTCRKCGGDMEQVSAENKSPLIMECRSCNHREHAEFQVPPEDFSDRNEMVYCRVVACRTSEKASKDEIKALRILIPDLGDLPIIEATRQINQSQNFDLGFHPAEEAQRLLAKVEDMGLQGILVGPDDDDAPDSSEQSFFESFGAPVTVGDPDEEYTVIPAWYLLAAAVLLISVAAVLVWMLL